MHVVWLSFKKRKSDKFKKLKLLRTQVTKSGVLESFDLQTQWQNQDKESIESAATSIHGSTGVEKVCKL
jgi:hypothetical protein